jgi:hypothetical protein
MGDSVRVQPAGVRAPVRDAEGRRHEDDERQAPSQDTLSLPDGRSRWDLSVMEDLGSLVAAAKKGSPEAFAAIYELLVRPVAGTCARGACPMSRI